MVSAPGFKDHFSGHAAGYAAYRPTYPRELVAFLAGMAPGRERALDAGCGSGQFSVLLADAFAEVVATDASAEQIAQATAHPNVAYRVARAESSDLPAASVDLVTVAQAAHWFDLDAFYAEVRRIARPHAVLALIAYGVFCAEPDIDPVLQRFYNEDTTPYWPPERRHVEAGYRTLPFPFPEIVPPALAITVDWRLADLLGYIDTWSAVRAMEKASGRGPMDRFAEDLAAAWGDPDRARPIRFPLSLRVGRVG
ncbi:MAG: methyltransferase domain-containing protein [Methylacidiphilales bacterium]|nr:methyltransferase domain-containing protein [Candidatus Methylacidiphilales bacterium]